MSSFKKLEFYQICLNMRFMRKLKNGELKRKREIDKSLKGLENARDKGFQRL